MHPNATHANLLIYPAPQGNTHHWFITGCFSFRGGNIGKPIQSPPLFWFTSPSGQHNKLPDFPAGHSTLALIHLQRAKSISYWQVLAPQIFHNYGGASVGASRSLSRRPLNKSNVNRTSGHSRHSCAWTFQQRTLNFEPLSLKHCFHTTSIQRKHLWLPPIGPQWQLLSFNSPCFIFSLHNIRIQLQPSYRIASIASQFPTELCVDERLAHLPAVPYNHNQSYSNIPSIGGEEMLLSWCAFTSHF